MIEQTRPLVRSYIARRQHHASLLCWCGGNELQGAMDGSKIGSGIPTPATHPLLQMMAGEAAELDPTRRFLHTSPTGPRAQADAKEYGQGLHWDIHGPWFPVPKSYWDNDDSLFRSEVGAAGASPIDILENYYEAGALLPLAEDNPRWARFGFWLQDEDFRKDHGRAPSDLGEWVSWSQKLQQDRLQHAALTSKKRFPGIGGFIVWMGHDTFPCPANTAILDFHGRPKPAADALREIFLTAPGDL